MWKNQDFYHSHSMKTKPYLSLSKYLSIFSVKIKAFLHKWSMALFISFPICINSPREFFCLPWRVKVSSPLGLCHVILGSFNRPCSPPKWLHSPWRANISFCLFFSFVNTPWRVGCELVASKHASLPIFFFVNSPWRVELLGRRANMLFCLFLALLHFVSFFPSLLSALSTFPAKLGKVR